jgi:LysW-gamma-L-lysine carboxypeptidase
MTIALRLPPGLDVEQIRNRVSDRQYSGANSVSSSVSSPIASITTRAYEQPFRADKRTPLVSAFLASIRSAGICGAADGKAALVTKTGTSDMNVVGPVWGCPIVAYGPGDSQLDHTPHEHLSLPEYLASIRVLTAVLQRLGDSDPLSAPGEGQG